VDLVRMGLHHVHLQLFSNLAFEAAIRNPAVEPEEKLTSVSSFMLNVNTENGKIFTANCVNIARCLCKADGHNFLEK
jgi:hypothetical protein